MVEIRYRVTLVAIDPKRREAVAEVLANVSGKSRDKVREAIETLPLKLTSRADLEAAARLRETLEAAGARVQVEAIDEEPGAVPAASRMIQPGPLGTWRRLRWAVRLVFSNPLLLAGMGLLYFLGTLVAGMPLALVLGDFSILADPGDPELVIELLDLFLAPEGLVALILNGLLGLLLNAWMFVMLYRLPVHWFREGRSPSLFLLAKEATSRFLDVAGAMVLVMLVPFVLIGLLVLGSMSGAIPEHGLVAGLVLLTGILFLFWYLFRMALVLPVAANEPAGPWRALVRGFRLARGRTAAIAGNLILLAVLWMIVTLVVLAGLGIIAQQTGGLPGVIASLTLAVLGVLLPVLLYVALAFLFELFYLEARVREEGLRPDWMELPAADWPRGSDRIEVLGHGRGLRSLRDFLVWNLAGLVVVAALAYLMIQTSSLSFEELVEDLQDRIEAQGGGMPPRMVIPDEVM